MLRSVYAYTYRLLPNISKEKLMIFLFHCLFNFRPTYYKPKICECKNIINFKLRLIVSNFDAPRMQIKHTTSFFFFFSISCLRREVLAYQIHARIPVASICIIYMAFWEFNGPFIDIFYFFPQRLDNNGHISW